MFNVVLKHPVSANYETKNTNIFQLFHCQQTQSLLISDQAIGIVLFNNLIEYKDIFRTKTMYFSEVKTNNKMR
jgi:hypothetical protein